MSFNGEAQAEIRPGVVAVMDLASFRTRRCGRLLRSPAWFLASMERGQAASRRRRLRTFQRFDQAGPQGIASLAAIRRRRTCEILVVMAELGRAGLSGAMWSAHWPNLAAVGVRDPAAIEPARSAPWRRGAAAFSFGALDPDRQAASIQVATVARAACFALSRSRQAARIFLW